MPAKRQDVQYRYYEAPPEGHIMALLGAGWIRPYGSEIHVPHFHNLLEIGYCYEGTGNMLYGDMPLSYSPGTVSVVPPNYLHNTVSKPGTKSRWEYLFIDVKSFLGEMYASNPKAGDRLLSRVYFESLHTRHDENRELGDLVLAIADLYRHKEEMYIDCAKGLLLALLIHIARQHPESSGVDDVPSVGALAISEALKYADSNYQNRFSVPEMADACHMSEAHFRRLFSQYMRMSPLEYVNRVRIEAACKLLRTTNASIRSIAARCGFLTLSTFNRNFRETMGVSPLKWRKEASGYERQLEKQNVILYDGWQ